MGTVDEKVKDLMESISKGATMIVADPKLIKELVDKGIVKERFISYEEYIAKLFSEREKNAKILLSKLPYIDKSIADSVVSDIYEEIKASYAFGIFTSTIFNSIVLLEYALRSYLYKELSKDKKIKWDDLENLTMGDLLYKIEKAGFIIGDRMKMLKNFTKDIRNPYLHINIKKLVKDVHYSQPIKGVDAKEKKIIELNNVDAKDYRFLWFSAKRFFDKEMVQMIIEFCVNETNKLLTGEVK